MMQLNELFELFDLFDFCNDYLSYFDYSDYLTRFFVDAAWLESVGSRILFELDPKKTCALRSSSRIYYRKAPSGPCW